MSSFHISIFLVSNSLSRWYLNYLKSLTASWSNFVQIHTLISSQTCMVQSTFILHQQKIVFNIVTNFFNFMFARSIPKKEKNFPKKPSYLKICSPNILSADLLSPWRWYRATSTGIELKSGTTSSNYSFDPNVYTMPAPYITHLKHSLSF